MNYYCEIENIVKEFCNSKPSPNYRGRYLEKSEKISKLYSKANSLGAEGVKHNDPKIVDIYNEIKKTLDY